MSDALPNQTPTEQPEAKPGGPAADQPGSEAPEAEAKADQDRENEEEEEGECGFCLFMKGGGCRDAFIEWEKCVEEAEKTKEDIVEKCVQVTAALKQCMEAHSDYYEPILRAEKAAEQQAIEELEKEAKEQGNTEGNTEDRASDSKQK